MRRTTKGLALGLVLVLAWAGAASSQAPGPTMPQVGNTVLMAQYECSPGDLAKVDQIMKEVAAPVLNRYVTEGKILTWGIIGAYVGGPTNRYVFVWGKDPVALLQARQAYLPEIMAKPGWAELGHLCPRQQVSLNNMLANFASTK